MKENYTNNFYTPYCVWNFLIVSFNVHVLTYDICIIARLSGLSHPFIYLVTRCLVIGKEYHDNCIFEAITNQKVLF